MKTQRKKKGSNKILRSIKEQAHTVDLKSHTKSSNSLYSGSKTLQTLPEWEIKELRLKTCRFITDFCHEHLFSNDPDAQKALKYLIEERGLTDKTIRNQKIGFCQKKALFRGDSCINYKYSCSIEHVNKIVPLDLFEKHIVFPIRDPETGDVVSFQARRVGEDGQGVKHISKNNECYTKSENLYLLYEAIDAIRDKGYVYLVEDVLDALHMHQMGFINTVALLTNNITDEQVSLIKKCIAGKSYEKHLTDVFLTLDNDEAGLNGLEQIYEKFKKTNLVVGAAIIRLPYKDPADWLNQLSRKKTIHPYLPFQPIYSDLYDYFKKRIGASLKTKHPVENFVNWNPKLFIDLAFCNLMLAQKNPDFYNKFKKIIEDCDKAVSTVSEETGQYTNEYIPRNETGYSEPQQGIQLH